jgi:hypothetical protein
MPIHVFTRQMQSVKVRDEFNALAGEFQVRSKAGEKQNAHDEERSCRARQGSLNAELAVGRVSRALRRPGQAIVRPKCDFPENCEYKISQCQQNCDTDDQSQ